MKRKTLAFFLLSAAATAFVMSANDAEAKWRRYNGVTCTNDGMLWRNLVGLNNYGNQTVSAWCDLGDDSYFVKPDIKVLNVHAYDGHNAASVRARVCTTTWNAWYGSCGTWSSSGNAFMGNTTLKPALGILSSVADFGMLEVQIPPGSALKGYYTAD